jgi:hypothetical protein
MRRAQMRFNLCHRRFLKAPVVISCGGLSLLTPIALIDDIFNNFIVLIT